MHTVCRMFTLLPDPPHIIYRVYEISDKENQNPALDFCDPHRNPIKYASLNYPTTIDNDANILVLNNQTVKLSVYFSTHRSGGDVTV